MDTEAALKVILGKLANIEGKISTIEDKLEAITISTNKNIEKLSHYIDYQITLVNNKIDGTNNKVEKL